MSLTKIVLLPCALLSIAITANALAQESVSGAAKNVANQARKAGEVAETLANDAFDKRTEVVDFEKGGTSVSEGETSSLRALIASLDSQPKAQKIYVAGWADQALPSEGRSVMGNDAVKLATKRIEGVERVLKTLSMRGEIVSVNLAKSPNTLQEIFGTKGAKVGNKALHGVDSDDAPLNDAGKVIQDKGGAGKVVVYVQ